MRHLYMCLPGRFVVEERCQNTMLYGVGSDYMGPSKCSGAGKHFLIVLYQIVWYPLLSFFRLQLALWDHQRHFLPPPLTHHLP
jgi:hypothetical protein